MRTVLASVTAALLAACAGPPAVRRDEAWPKLTIRSADGSIHIAKDTVYHCRKSGFNGPGNEARDYELCSKGLPVLVLSEPVSTDSPFGCVAVVPYAKVRIHGDRTSGDLPIVWKLYSPGNYVFDDTEGIWFKPPPGSPQRPGDFIDVIGRANDLFRVRVKASITNDFGFNFGPKVWKVLVGGTRGECRVIDPLIVNHDN